MGETLGYLKAPPRYNIRLMPVSSEKGLEEGLVVEKYEWRYVEQHSQWCYLLQGRERTQWLSKRVLVGTITIVLDANKSENPKSTEKSQLSETKVDMTKEAQDDNEEEEEEEEEGG